MSTESQGIDLLQPELPKAQLPLDVLQSGNHMREVLRRAEAVVVDSPEVYELLARQMQQINKQASDIEERRKSFTRPLDALKQQWMDLFRGPQELAERVVETIKRKLLDYDRKQDELRREAQRKALEDATRLERERQEELRKAREEAEAQAAREREAAQEELRKAAATGDLAKAEAAGRQLDLIRETEVEQVQAIEAAAENPAPLPIVPEYVAPPVKVAGMARKKVWQINVDDKNAVIAQACGLTDTSTIDPRIAALLNIDEKALRQLVHALGLSHGVRGVTARQVDALSAGKK